MHQKYIELFKEVTHATEILAEQVMNFDHERKDDKGEATAQSMRDDYTKLYDRMRADDFDAATLTKIDYAKLLVGVLIIVNNLETKIANEQKAVKNYKDEIVTRLDRVVNESENDETARELAEQLFIINEDK